MQKTFYLDLSGMATEKEVHQSLKTLLSLPLYYGENLDALYDVLCTRTQKCMLWIAQAQNAPDKLKRLIERVETVFKEAGHDALRID